MLYFGHIAGILKDPKNEWALIEEDHYSAKTVFSTQISILAAIPAVALYIGLTQVRLVSCRPRACQASIIECNGICHSLLFRNVGRSWLYRYLYALDGKNVRWGSVAG